MGDVYGHETVDGTKRVEVNLEILKANIDFPTQFAEVLARYRILLVYR